MADLPLAELDAFATVARLRSFRAAGKLRRVSASSLSEAMRRLETRLEVRLLNRTTRSVTVTDAGRRLLERLAPLLGEIETALDDINDFRDRPAGRLRLNVPSIVARCILPDIACRFLALYPDITLEVATEDAYIDVVGEGYDAGIRYEEELQQDMIALPLGPRRQRYVTVASPAYLERCGTPTHPRDLVDHHGIQHRFASGRLAAWSFERDGETISVSPKARLIAGSLDMEQAAVIAGLGITLTFEEMVGEALASGQLVEILPDWSDSFSGPFLYYHGRKYMPAALRAFVDFVRRDGGGGP
ncbi:LysR family transcriptional regulator [Hoeflea marina]|uniref:LysR family transcriptional regulator n=1 Tax=Hoeflea marina TaxID=274592 RepID=A0A317PEX5_9HYPH|nr:LysR family transcriptional regulator [Hoeflea marina]PWV97666.1 LysR family transcriptional regulator [Hoeflea marina]